MDYQFLTSECKDLEDQYELEYIRFDEKVEELNELYKKIQKLKEKYMELNKKCIDDYLKLSETYSKKNEMKEQTKTMKLKIVQDKMYDLNKNIKLLEQDNDEKPSEIKIGINMETPLEKLSPEQVKYVKNLNEIKMLNNKMSDLELELKDIEENDISDDFEDDVEDLCRVIDWEMTGEYL
jgi:myosin heavy subunit